MGAVKLDNLASAFNFCLHRKFQELFTEKKRGIRNNHKKDRRIKGTDERTELIADIRLILGCKH